MPEHKFRTGDKVKWRGSRQEHTVVLNENLTTLLEGPAGNRIWVNPSSITLVRAARNGRRRAHIRRR